MFVYEEGFFCCCCKYCFFLTKVFVCQTRRWFGNLYCFVKVKCMFTLHLHNKESLNFRDIESVIVFDKRKSKQALGSFNKDKIKFASDSL